MKKILTIVAFLCASMAMFAIDWSSYAWIGNGTGNASYTEKFKANVTPSGMTINNLQVNATKNCIHVICPAAVFGASSLDASEYHTEGAGLFLHLDAFKAQETEFTLVCNGTTYTFTVYYADGEPEDLTGFNLAKNKTVTAGHSASPAVNANDADVNSRWGSEGGQHYAAVGDAAEDWWFVDLGGFYEIQQVKILFERANPSDYDILISNNAASWTVIGTYTEESKFGNNPETDYNVYNFTDKVGRYVKIFARAGYANLAYGFSMYEFEVYGERATLEDHNPPTINSASLSGDPEWNQVHIAVSGTDTEDGAVTSFRVTDATHGVDQSCIAANGIITVTDLSGETAYSFTVKAVDTAGNESTNSVVVNVTTAQDTSVPLVGAPTPSGTNKDVVHIYSDAFPSTDGHSSCLAHDFKKDGFGGVALMEEKNISGDKCLIYNINGAAEVTCGHWDGGINAIIAADGYHHESYTGIDASEMEYLHVDIWSLQACSNINIQINDVSLNTKRSHNGNGWNSYDIALTDYTFGDGEHTRVSNVRFMKFNGLNSITGKMALDNIYFWKTASGLKSVSATPNNPAMGAATVKQNSVAVTEVTTGSEVTFSAVANEGYIFVNWSSGETNATFNTTVDANMNLTANFRALGHISCNEELTNGNYTVYVTYRKTVNENEYEFIVRSAQTMTGFSNAYIGRINGNNQVNLNGQGSLSGNGHKLSYTFTSTTEPKLNTPLYVNFANHGEVTFNQINNGTTFEFSQACANPEITAIALNQTEATLDMGNTLTLTPSFTPAYMSADIEWQTSDNTKATVDNGVVTPVAPGNVTITAKVSETIKATCAVTVQTSQSHNWYGYGTDHDLDYTYRIEYTTDHHIVAHVKRQGDKVGLVDVGMNINNVWTTVNVTEGEDEGWKKGTTQATYTAGDNLTIILQSNYSGASSILNISYTVGADNVMPTIEPSVLKLSTASMSMSMTDADVQLTAEIHHRDAANKAITWISDDENVVTVVNGLVHPVGVGTTTVRAATYNAIEATCDVTVVGVLKPTVFWGNGTNNGVAIAYSITRNTNHTLTYAIEALQSKVGFAVRVNDGSYHDATLNEGIYTWTSEATYTDGDIVNGFIYMPYSGGDARVDFSYTVGSASEKEAYIPITLDANTDDPAWIEANDGEIRDVEIVRPMTADTYFKTICFPFSMTAEQVAETFGECEILRLAEAHMKSATEMYIRYAPVSTIEAGYPYLITLLGESNLSKLDFTGVTINSSTLNNRVTVDAGEGKGLEMIGTFVNISCDDNDEFYLDATDNLLHSIGAYCSENSQASLTIPAFRCYFRLTGFSNPVNVCARVGRSPYVVTGTEETQSSATPTKQLRGGQLFILRDGNVYTITGVVVK